ETLPLTPNGKLDRKALPAPGPAAESGVEPVAPRTPVEAGLAEIWRDVLGVPRVGIHDDFFELGGHSLVATRLASRIRSTFGVEALGASLTDILLRHEALRTTFTAVDGVPVQQAREPAPLRLPVTDLGALAAPEREVEARRRIDEEALRPFDLNQGPLFRAL